jgi:hypothetical protein
MTASLRVMERDLAGGGGGGGPCGTLCERRSIQHQMSAGSILAVLPANTLGQRRVLKENPTFLAIRITAT